MAGLYSDVCDVVAEVTEGMNNDHAERPGWWSLRHHTKASDCPGQGLERGANRWSAEYAIIAKLHWRALSVKYMQEELTKRQN